MRLFRPSLLPILLFAACSGSHPLAGSWNQEIAGGGVGASIEFDGGSDRCTLHTAPRPDGTHDHVDGTYTFDAATGAVTVKAPLLGTGKASTWSGKIDGEHLHLESAADGKLEFHRGKSAHGH